MDILKIMKVIKMLILNGFLGFLIIFGALLIKDAQTDTSDAAHLPHYAIQEEVIKAGKAMVIIGGVGVILEIVAIYGLNASYKGIKINGRKKKNEK